MKNLISIVTPSYNQGHFIKKTIESILTQEGTFFIDYIIKDGGSKDETVSIIKELEKKLIDNCDVKMIEGLKFYIPRSKEFVYGKCFGISFRWVSEKDKGQTDAINKGFKEAKGPICAYINSDDFYLPGVFQKVHETFDTKRIDVLVGNVMAVDKDGIELWRQLPVKPSKLNMLYHGVAPQQPGMFYITDLVRRVGYCDESLNYIMDIDLWFRFLFAKATFHKVEDFFAVQHYHEDAKSLEGGNLCAAFAPEDKRIKRSYKDKLGIKHYFYVIRYRIDVTLYAFVKKPYKALKLKFKNFYKAVI